MTQSTEVQSTFIVRSATDRMVVIDRSWICDMRLSPLELTLLVRAFTMPDELSEWRDLVNDVQDLYITRAVDNLVRFGYLAVDGDGNHAFVEPVQAFDQAVRPMLPQPVERGAVYRYFDDNERLLYVGVSKVPDARDRTHRRSSPWFQFVARRDVTWYSTQKEAEIAEARAIADEAPLFNVAGNACEASCVRLRDYLLAVNQPRMLHLVTSMAAAAENWVVASRVA